MLALRFGPAREARVADLALELAGLVAGRELVPVDRHRHLAGAERGAEAVPVPAEAAGMGDRDEPAVEVGGLDRLGGVEDRVAGVGGADPADVVAVLEVVAAVGPQHVREVVHQRVVLLGLVAVAVGDVVLGVLLEPLGGLVELLPGRVVRRRRVEAEVLLHAVAVLLEQVLAVLPDHRRRVVGQRVELVLVDEAPGGVELGRDEVADVVELGQVRVLHHRVQVDERLVVRRQDLVRVGVDDLVACRRRRRSRARPSGRAPPARAGRS